LAPKDEFGSEATEAITNLKRNLSKLKKEGAKIGTEQDSKPLRDQM
jgi:hypothetical protein